MIRPDNSLNSISVLILALICATLVCGCEKKINNESELKIKTNLKHSHRQVELEIDSDKIEKRENQFARDEITPPEGEPLESYLTESLKLVEALRSDEAIKALKEEIKKNPENSRAYSYLGKVYRSLENFKEARICFDRAIALQPRDPFPYCLRAEMNYHRENYREAIRDCDRALKLDKRYGHAYALRGEANLQLKNYNNAIADLGASARLNPRYSPVLIDLGDAYLKTGKYKEAISQYSKAIELDKDNGIFYARRARAHKLNNEEKQYLEDDKKARQLGFVDEEQSQTIEIPEKTARKK